MFRLRFGGRRLPGSTPPLQVEFFWYSVISVGDLDRFRRQDRGPRARLGPPLPQLGSTFTPGDFPLSRVLFPGYVVPEFGEVFLRVLSSRKFPFLEVQRHVGTSQVVFGFQIRRRRVFSGFSAADSDNAGARGGGAQRAPSPVPKPRFRKRDPPKHVMIRSSRVRDKAGRTRDRLQVD